MISSAQQGETVSVPLNRQDPSIDTATLEAGLFRDVLGEYTTKVSGTSARRSNVQLSGEKCNGVILLPGEVFDYNAVVGERTAEAGFRRPRPIPTARASWSWAAESVRPPAPSTAPPCMPIWRLWSGRTTPMSPAMCPSAWMPRCPGAGRSSSSRTTPTIRSRLWRPMRTTGRRSRSWAQKVSDFTVEITTSTLSVISPTVREVPDATLAAGTTVVEDNGHTGYKVQSYRHVYDGNGNLISEGKRLTAPIG